MIKPQKFKGGKLPTPPPRGDSVTSFMSRKYI